MGVPCHTYIYRQTDRQIHVHTCTHTYVGVRTYTSPRLDIYRSICIVWNRGACSAALVLTHVFVCMPRSSSPGVRCWDRENTWNERLSREPYQGIPYLRRKERGKVEWIFTERRSSSSSQKKSPERERESDVLQTSSSLRCLKAWVSVSRSASPCLIDSVVSKSELKRLFALHPWRQGHLLSEWIPIPMWIEIYIYACTVVSRYLSLSLSVYLSLYICTYMCLSVLGDLLFSWLCSAVGRGVDSKSLSSSWPCNGESLWILFRYFTTLFSSPSLVPLLSVIFVLALPHPCGEDSSFLSLSFHRLFCVLCSLPCV